MPSNINHDSHRVESMEQADRELRILPRIFSNVSISLASIAFTGILLFAAYQGYLYFRGRAIYVRLTEIIFLVVVGSLVIILLLLAINVALLLIRSATRTGKIVSKDIDEIRENLDPKYRAKSQSAKFLIDGQPKKELPAPTHVIDGSVEKTDR
jgi:hypothetical protein